MTDRYWIVAIVILALLAIASKAMLHGTVFFAAAAFAIALLVAVHHIIASFGSDDAPDRCTLFQGRPASSFHITAAAVVGVVSMLRL
jgi:hypothetical protein